MSKKDNNADIVTREVGEHVSFGASFEAEKTKDLGEGVIEATISTSSVDHHGEVINQDGVDVSQYHGTVLYGHDYEGLPIGKTLSMKKFKNKMTARFQLAVKEYPFAATIYEMIKGGYLTDVSIGGMVAKWSDDYRTIEEMIMKEFSVVPIGANSDAQITSKGIKAAGKTFDTVKEEYQDFAKKVLLDKMESMPDDELKDAIKTLKTLTARLEETAEGKSLADVNSLSATKRYTIMKDAKAVAQQSQNIITTIKIKIKE